VLRMYIHNACLAKTDRQVSAYENIPLLPDVVHMTPSFLKYMNT
jgi:hypothetical protein